MLKGKKRKQGRANECFRKRLTSGSSCHMCSSTSVLKRTPRHDCQTTSSTASWKYVFDYIPDIASAAYWLLPSGSQLIGLSLPEFGIERSSRCDVNSQRQYHFPFRSPLIHAIRERQPCKHLANSRLWVYSSILLTNSSRAIVNFFSTTSHMAIKSSSPFSSTVYTLTPSEIN